MGKRKDYRQQKPEVNPLVCHFKHIMFEGCDKDIKSVATTGAYHSFGLQDHRLKREKVTPSKLREKRRVEVLVTTYGVTHSGRIGVLSVDYEKRPVKRYELKNGKYVLCKIQP